MIKDYRNADQRLNRKQGNEEHLDWWTLAYFAIAMSFMFLFVNACLFWIDYAIIRLNNF